MPLLYKNNARSVLTAGISETDTEITVTDGDAFPTPSGGDTFLATLVEVNAVGIETAWEIILVTARVGNLLTVTRAQEDTPARAWNASTVIENRFTAGAVNIISQSVSDAETAATNAQQSESNAATILAGLGTSVTDATDAAAAAQGHETNAGNSAALADTARIASESARDGAETAETNAGGHETAAQTARTGAETAETNAQSHATAAQTARTGAETAETNAESHKDAAALSQTGAETAETNAGTHETNAGNSATAAQNAQSYSEEWASADEDVLVSAAAGGNQVDEYSSKHWAAKAEAHKDAAGLSEIVAGNHQANAATNEGNAAAHASTAETHKNDAETAKTAAEAAAASFTKASQAEAEAGLEDTKYMTALKTKQAIDALGGGGGGTVATQQEAEDAVADDVYMTPLKTRQAIDDYLLVDGLHHNDSLKGSWFGTPYPMLQSTDKLLVGSTAYETVVQGTTVQLGTLASNGTVVKGDMTAEGDIIFDAGKGLDFSATTDAATTTSELLDDYEEGEWAIAVVDNSLSTSEGQNYFGSGSFTKIGDDIDIWWSITISGMGSLGGDTIFSGLPYAAKASGPAGGAIMTKGIAFDGSTSRSITGVIKNSTSHIELWQGPDAAGDWSLFSTNSVKPAPTATSEGFGSYKV